MKKFFSSLLVFLGVSSLSYSSADFTDFRDALAKGIGLNITWGDQPYQVSAIKAGDATLRPVQNTEAMQEFFVALFGDEQVVKYYATGKPIEAQVVRNGLAWRSGLWATNFFSSWALYDKFHRLSGRVTVGHGEQKEGEGVSEIEAIWTPDFKPHMISVGVAALKWAYFVQQMGAKVAERESADLAELKRFNVGRWVESGFPLKKIISTVSSENKNMVKALDLLGFTLREEKESRHDNVVKLYYDLPFTFDSVEKFNAFISGIEKKAAEEAAAPK